MRERSTIRFSTRAHALCGRQLCVGKTALDRICWVFLLAILANVGRWRVGTTPDYLELLESHAQRTQHCAKADLPVVILRSPPTNLLIQRVTKRSFAVTRVTGSPSAVTQAD